mmetsp:Transcript_30507/g.57123  ORF Transcript_30507/g.57123 Transcript_30507/m.57123 type:complete len:95 (-) Transcript_30507:105-389(-)
MGNGNITMEKKCEGKYVEISDEDGQLKRIIRETGERVPLKKIFVKLSDVCSISQKINEKDVLFTLENGVEYVLDDLEDPDATYAQFVEFIMSDD